MLLFVHLGGKVFVGVHGIGQQQLGRHQLRGAWSLALRDGLERAVCDAVDEPALDIAFYGDLFLNSEGELSKSSVTGPGAHEELSDAEVVWLRAAASEILARDEPLLFPETQTKSAARMPPLLLPVAAALDRHLGHRAGALLVGELRQVRRYLIDREIKEEVDQRVRRCTTGCRVLIGHSLGSVVAFEYVRQNPRHRLDLFLTLGSPLGLRTVRSLMPNPRYGAIRRIPNHVGSWVNLRDPSDPVACAGNLAAFWPGVVDQRVDNGNDPHAATRYLGKRETGEAVRTAVPGWADV
ncbi:hypothetical protein [Streptomyces geranii]|uniref:hypothetical protein n=1 Tax=Streptomyces geranii TaxID=2058923 RepID=UPI000D029EC8|nr:hypothetical protein [Streptomyces geranii]